MKLKEFNEQKKLQLTVELKTGEKEIDSDIPNWFASGMESSKKSILRQCDWADSQGCLNQEITKPMM